MPSSCTTTNYTPSNADLATNAEQSACAWCLREQGLPMGHGSHGICTMHAARLLAEHRARKEARRSKR
jgi:hypothetical protein